jgi:hypothetical protein
MENPYQSPQLPADEPDEFEPTWGLSRYFGLTIVEWFVVGAVIVILAGLAMPAYQSNCRPRSRPVEPAGP